MHHRKQSSTREDEAVPDKQEEVEDKLALRQGLCAAAAAVGETGKEMDEEKEIAKKKQKGRIWAHAPTAHAPTTSMLPANSFRSRTPH
ncbi:hypothetical protein NKR19_g9858 [Coniochaeta hoffmannii]|uniref:Uncharacterized protein n=1 Tax=Coniochaeta hoffmannii TaxID=91930 RepID=A0AA38R0I8_9PEZI|nr:hypothetical protein NKR19_g9858 [Coniochaeta hoffmannii]